MALGDDVRLRNIGSMIAFSRFMMDGARIHTGAMLAIGLRRAGRGGPAANSIPNCVSAHLIYKNNRLYLIHIL
jgi:hypothetical protein